MWPRLKNNHIENDFYLGGETEETTGNTLDASFMANDVTIDMGQTVQTSYAAMVLDVTIDEDTNNNIIAGYGNYIPHLGQATITDTGVAGSSATALEPGSGVTDTGGTSITIDGIVYNSFGRIEQVDVITVDGTITGHIWLRPIPMATLRPRRYFCQMRAQQTKPIFPT